MQMFVLFSTLFELYKFAVRIRVCEVHKRRERNVVGIFDKIHLLDIERAGRVVYKSQ